jgi:hypothetical protein
LGAISLLAALDLDKLFDNMPIAPFRKSAIAA